MSEQKVVESRSLSWVVVALLVLGAAPSEGADGGAGTPEAETFLQVWLAAQNAGHFDDYGALYDAEFQGVRRSGTRTRVFDRAGWLADRARMFKKPMQVEARDFKVAARGNDIEVVFTQIFTSGSYQDEGAKAIVLRKRPGGLRIVREEMLSSGVERASPSAAAGKPPAAAGMPSAPTTPRELTRYVVRLDRTFDSEQAAKDALHQMRNVFAEEPVLRSSAGPPDLGLVDRLAHLVPAAAADGTWAVSIADCPSRKDAEALAPGLKRVGPIRTAEVHRDYLVGDCPEPHPVDLKKTIRAKLGDGKVLEARVFEPVGAPTGILPAVSVILRGDKGAALDADVIMDGAFEEVGANAIGCEARVKGMGDHLDVRYSCSSVGLPDGCWYSSYRASFVARANEGRVVVERTSSDASGHRTCAE